MIRYRLICLLAALFVVLLTGCGMGSVEREVHADTMESVAVSGYSGVFSRVVGASKGQERELRVKLSARGGHVSITIVDRDGNSFLSLNERATLDEANGMLVTVPAEGQPDTLRVDMKRFTGEYGISWADQTEDVAGCIPNGGSAL